MGRNPFSIKIVVAGEGGGAEGDLQLLIYFKGSLSGEWISFPCYKTHCMFLIYDICGSSEHCEPLLAYVSVLFHLS